MNARPYLCLLRPGRTLAVLTMYGWLAWSWLHFLFGLPNDASRFSPSRSSSRPCSAEF